MSNENGWETHSAPPPMDESWWAAVMKDEERVASPPRGRGTERGQLNGSAEDWGWARALYETDATIELPVVGFNRGGLLLEARGLRGFIPISHLISVVVTPESPDRPTVLASLVGKQLCVKVIEFDPERGRLVFSERAAVAGPGRRTELLASLQPGDRVRGQVTNITRFGVFVDLGGIEGLIHVSELSWGRVRHPADVVRCGQEIEVDVLSVDRDLARVALSLKEMLPDPWLSVAEHYQVGQVVEGTVTNVVRFGAFVGLEEGLEGLVHVSEIGDCDESSTHDVLQEGERVRARVLHIVPSERRLGLSLRQVPPAGDEQSLPAGEPEALTSN
jgi:small subunit ribosomal protein S1